MSARRSVATAMGTAVICIDAPRHFVRAHIIMSSSLTSPSGENHDLRCEGFVFSKHSIPREREVNLYQSISDNRIFLIYAHTHAHTFI